MQWLLADETPRLEDWVSRPFWPDADRPSSRGRRDAFERVLALERPGPPEPDGPFRRVERSIRAFEVFPRTLIRGVLARAPVELGDTVGIRYRFAPGVSVFFAARVVEIIDRETSTIARGGFTYRTLVGHPELGQETFSIEKNLASGEIKAALRSWSRPGTRLAKLGAPLLRAIQVRANNAALDNLQRVATGNAASVTS